VTVRFRGRELTHPEIGRALLARFVEQVKEHGVAERTPLLEGKSMHITMASVHKPKGHDAPDRRHPPGVTPADATAEPPPAPESKTAVAQPTATAPTPAAEPKPTTAPTPATEPKPAMTPKPAATPEPVQAGE
jgi:Translation initiation factor IF-3, C-terminal domain